MKKTLLITPNTEAEILSKLNQFKKGYDQSWKILISLGPKCLIKGGHLKSNQMNDILLNKKTMKIFTSKNIEPKIRMGLVVRYLQQLQPI